MSSHAWQGEQMGRRGRKLQGQLTPVSQQKVLRVLNFLIIPKFLQIPQKIGKQIGERLLGIPKRKRLELMLCLTPKS